MFVPESGSKCPVWNGYTLLMPAVSVGNVGQLATDLIISTLSMKKVGYFYDDSFLPVIGNDPYAGMDSSGSCDLVTAVEVYEDATHQLVAIQQRAPFAKGKRGLFAEKLLKWVTSSGFKEVLLLSSSHSHERLDKQLSGTQLRFVFTPKLETSSKDKVSEKLGWVELEKRPPLPGENNSEHSEIFIPGGGIAKSLYTKCVSAEVPLGIVLRFCGEGDNTADAIDLASYINSWKQWVDLKKNMESMGPTFSRGWKVPSSWKLLYGNRFDQILFR